MSNFERDMANTMLDAADARIASLEADKADLLRVLSIADEKIRSGEDARGQYIRENAALEARCRGYQKALKELVEARWDSIGDERGAAFNNAEEVLTCRYLLIGRAGDPCPNCDKGPCPFLTASETKGDQG